MRLTTVLLCSALAVIGTVPSAAHATPLCEAVLVDGTGIDYCIPYDGDVTCAHQGNRGDFVYVLICVPKLLPGIPPGQPNTAR
jgi:hypothetical protein